MAEAAPAEVRAAGAVLWRPGADGAAVEVALVHRPRYGDWSFPKGKALPREHLLATAVREVAEETGFPAVLGRRLRPACYVSEGRPKRVDYWAARPAGPAAFTPNSEVDEVAWLPLPQALERLSYPHDAALLAEFASAPAASAPIILLRHASAVSKSGWRAAGHPDDLARPLTGRGRSQARALAQTLGCLGPARVVSSGAERCVATVRPYSAATGAVVEADPVLEPGRAEEHLRPLIGAVADRAAPTVICAHRENLPGLLALACERFGAAAPAGPRLRKGAFWVLQTGEGRLLSAERHHVAP